MKLPFLKKKFSQRIFALHSLASQDIMIDKEDHPLFLFKHLLFPFDHRTGDAILRARFTNGQVVLDWSRCAVVSTAFRRRGPWV
jgi:hypothetical protein